MIAVREWLTLVGVAYACVVSTMAYEAAADASRVGHYSVIHADDPPKVNPCEGIAENAALSARYSWDARDAAREARNWAWKQDDADIDPIYSRLPSAQAEKRIKDREAAGTITVGEIFWWAHLKAQHKERVSFMAGEEPRP